MEKIFDRDHGYLRKISKKIKKNSPYSDDLENFQITTEDIKKNID